MPPTGPDLMHNHGGQSPMTAPDRAGLVGALLHGLAVLDLFDREHTVLGIGEMAWQLGVHRSTASRLAAPLCHHWRTWSPGSAKPATWQSWKAARRSPWLWSTAGTPSACTPSSASAPPPTPAPWARCSSPALTPSR